MRGVLCRDASQSTEYVTGSVSSLLLLHFPAESRKRAGKRAQRAQRAASGVR